MVNRKGFGRKRSGPGIFLEGLRKTRKIIRINDVPTEIKTKHLHNTNIKRYHYANPLSNLLKLAAGVREIYTAWKYTNVSNGDIDLNVKILSNGCIMALWNFGIQAKRTLFYIYI
jgi:hypothetical protein